MITTAMAITRGTGTFNMVFDFAVASPAVDVLATDKWMLQIQQNKSTRIMKLNSVAGGAADQILLTPATDLVTIYLTEQEKNEIPDSGYAYVLYKWNETTNVWDIQAYASVTNTGSAPEEYLPEALSWVNGHTLRTIATGATTDTASEKDDTLFCSPANLASLTITLPDADAMIGKILKIKNSGQGTVNINDASAVEITEIDNVNTFCLLQARGNDADDWVLLFKI
jgi:hypothetical protein